MHELPLFLFVRQARQRPRRLSGKSIVQIPLFRGCQARVKTSGLVAGEVVRNAEGLAKAQCNTVLATLTPNNARNRVEGYYAGPNAKLGISVIAVWHITDHYGQLVEYLR